MRILAPDLLELVRITSDTNTWNFVTNGTAAPPATNHFQVKSGSNSIPVSEVGFKRRVLYAPLEIYDLRIENTIYLWLTSTNWAASNTSFVERHNGTDRHQNSRKHRKTYGFLRTDNGSGRTEKSL